MASSIHLTNSKGRNATVGLLSIKGPPSPKMGLPEGEIVFKRYIAATDAGTDAALKARYGKDYAKQLIESDPEVDLEKVGCFLEQTQSVYLDGSGQIMYAEPKFIELVLNADGTEKERREPVDASSNINGETPVRWTGRKLPIKDAVRRFSFRRRVQLRHVDGLTFDFLFQVAKELEESQALMLLGTGDKGTGALIFQANGRPYRGFLSGRTHGTSYQLILHLSDMELKKPVPLASKKTRDE
jgi:hypothetical protein